MYVSQHMDHPLTGDSDVFAYTIANMLLEDFKPFLEEEHYSRFRTAMYGGNVVASLRKLQLGGIQAFGPNLPIYQFKMIYQLLDLFKKFSFDDDLYSEEQVLEDSKKKFMDNQRRVNSFQIVEDTELKALLFSTRGYICDLLGDFDKIEVMERATFGKKSSVGVPMRKACEAERYEAPITGSHDHIVWFDKLYSKFNRPAFDYAERISVNRKVPKYRQIDVLEAVLVNKTWKSKRLIMPNTTLGTLYSSGLGRVLEDRLRAAGYDIRTLQVRHGQLAQLGSLTGSLVTADQSLASDNITVKLIDRIFPRPWASALKLGRIEEVEFYGDRFRTETFSTMGIGFTFPLQTLVFLSLLFAIRDHLGLSRSSVVSVFGDDLIYDKEMHDMVMRVFPKLGLIINEDKTFADGGFRESCGYDYYHGVDVRPFHLARSDGDVSCNRRRFEAYLYKAFNGLKRRWRLEEVPAAFVTIVNEIKKIRKGSDPLVVPTDFPDTSGLKLTTQEIGYLDLEVPKRNRNGSFNFRFLSFEPKRRKEDRHDPYYFQKLRSQAQTDQLAYMALLKVENELIRKKMLSLRLVCHGTIFEESTPVFRSVPDKKAGTFRSRLNGRWHCYSITEIPEQDQGRFREQSGVSINWTPG